MHGAASFVKFIDQRLSLLGVASTCFCFLDLAVAGNPANLNSSVFCCFIRPKDQLASLDVLTPGNLHVAQACCWTARRNVLQHSHLPISSPRCVENLDSVGKAGGEGSSGARTAPVTF